MSTSAVTGAALVIAALMVMVSPGGSAVGEILALVVKPTCGLGVTVLVVLAGVALDCSVGVAASWLVGVAVRVAVGGRVEVLVGMVIGVCEGRRVAVAGGVGVRVGNEVAVGGRLFWTVKLAVITWVVPVEKSMAAVIVCELSARA